MDKMQQQAEEATKALTASATDLTPLIGEIPTDNIPDIGEPGKPVNPLDMMKTKPVPVLTPSFRYAEEIQDFIEQLTDKLYAGVIITVHPPKQEGGKKPGKKSKAYRYIPYATTGGAPLLKPSEVYADDRESIKKAVANMIPDLMAMLKDGKAVCIYPPEQRKGAKNNG